MVRISSQSTFFSKRVFPTVWFAVIFISASFAAANGSALGILAAALTAIVSYVIMRSLLFDLADEVCDCGDALVVRNGGKEQQIPLIDITNVSYSGCSNPARITLRLRHATDFGKEVSFLPAPPRARSFSLVPEYWFSMPPLAEDLIERIDSARNETTKRVE